MHNKRMLYSYFILFSNFLCNRQLVLEGLLLHSQVKHKDACPYPKHRKKKGGATFDSPFPIAMKINGALPYQESKGQRGLRFSNFACVILVVFPFCL